MTFSGRYLLNIIQFAAHQGVPFKSLLRLSGYSVEMLLEENRRVNASIYNRIIEEAVVQTKDPFFGLHAGEYLNLSAAGLIGQITQSASTMKEALQYCCEFAALGCRAIPMELKETDTYQLVWSPDAIWQKQSAMGVQQTLDGLLSFALREFHTLTLQNDYPIKMHFKREQPDDIEAYSCIFNCPLYFSQTETSMFFSAEQMLRPIITSNYTLLRILVKYAYEKLASLKDNNQFSQTVRKAIINLLDPGFPTIEQVAGNLNMAVRTLQRKLEKEGVTFKDLLESLREDFAREYMANKSLNIGDVAFLLSYADSSSFARSFKRWTGKTPVQYRAEI